MKAIKAVIRGVRIMNFEGKPLVWITCRTNKDHVWKVAPGNDKHIYRIAHQETV